MNVQGKIPFCKCRRNDPQTRSPPGGSCCSPGRSRSAPKDPCRLGFPYVPPRISSKKTTRQFEAMTGTFRYCMACSRPMAWMRRGPASDRAEASSRRYFARNRPRFRMSPALVTSKPALNRLYSEKPILPPSFFNHTPALSVLSLVLGLESHCVGVLVCTLPAGSSIYNFALRSLLFSPLPYSPITPTRRYKLHNPKVSNVGLLTLLYYGT